MDDRLFGSANAVFHLIRFRPGWHDSRAFVLCGSVVIDSVRDGINSHFVLPTQTCLQASASHVGLYFNRLFRLTSFHGQSAWARFGQSRHSMEVRRVARYFEWYLFVAKCVGSDTDTVQWACLSSRNWVCRYSNELTTGREFQGVSRVQESHEQSLDINSHVT